MSTGLEIKERGKEKLVFFTYTTKLLQKQHNIPQIENIKYDHVV